jgi:hypothetical protein
MDQNSISNGQLQMKQQQQLIQQEQHLMQQQQQQQQQQHFVPQQFYSIQQSGYSITPIQHTNFSAPSLVTAQPSQQAQNLTNNPATRNTIKNRQHEGAQDETTQYTWQTIKKRKRNSPILEDGVQRPEINCNNRYEQLSQLQIDDNDDVMFTNTTNNTQLQENIRGLRDPKRSNKLQRYGGAYIRNHQTGPILL